MPPDAETFDDPMLLTPEQQEDRIFREVLVDITEAARDFAHLLLATARQAHDPAEIIRLSAAFDRASRSARRGILLAKHLRKSAEPAETRNRHPRASALATQSLATPSLLTEPPLPESPLPESPLTEARQRELRDRLDAIDPDRSIALGNAPIPQAIAALHRELKLVFEELSKPLYKPKSPQLRPHIPDH